jgi:hypothetical protein
MRAGAQLGLCAKFPLSLFDVTKLELYQRIVVVLSTI